MAKEPILEFRLTEPDYFRCSLCEPRKNAGMFSITTSAERLVNDFRQHVKEWHSRKDVNQAAARIVREATGA